MPAPIDMAGQRYGRLIAIRRNGSDNNRAAMWEFRCDCGAVCTMRANDVRRGRAVSCGCVKRANAKAAAARLHAAGLHRMARGPRAPDVIAYVAFMRRRSIARRLGAKTETLQYIDGQPAPL